MSFKSICDIIYPVGSIYTSTSSTNPASLFGGTWTQITGRFLLGVGSNTANTNSTYGTCAAGTINRSVKEKGGEASHTLTTSEMPAHNHALRMESTGGSMTVALEWSSATSGGSMYSGTDWIEETGGDGAHNNIPPYYTVYMWERTA